MAHGYPTEVPMKAIQAADRGGYEALRLVTIARPRPGPARPWCG